MAVLGKRLDVSVSAPPMLDMLAAMERNRDEGPIWPVTLDQAGKSCPRPAPPSGEADARAAEAARS
jgi:hypothetical protein